MFAERELGKGADTVVLYSIGLRWCPCAALTLDVAGGSRLRGDAEDFATTAGLTWTFGPAGTQTP